MLLATNDLVAGYVPEVDILDGVTIEVHDGEIVTVVGPNEHRIDRHSRIGWDQVTERASAKRQCGSSGR